MDIITLKEAKEKGLIYYYTGKPCKHGHDSLRLVKGGACRQCKNEFSEKLRNRPEAKQKATEYHRERHKRTYSTEKRRETYSKNIEKEMFLRAKKRSEAKGIEFDLSLDDITIPERCPILGIILSRKVDGKKENSPSLDRRDSSKGYTRDNITVISNRANRIKSDASLQEIEMILKYMKGVITWKKVQSSSLD